MTERYFIIDRLFPSGDLRVKLEINGELIAMRRFSCTPIKQVFKEMRAEYGLKHKKIHYCWL